MKSLGAAGAGRFTGPPALTVAVVGTLLFLNVYAPQSLLPLLASTFQVSAAQVEAAKNRFEVSGWESG